MLHIGPLTSVLHKTGSFFFPTQLVRVYQLEFKWAAPLCCRKDKACLQSIFLPTSDLVQKTVQKNI